MYIEGSGCLKVNFILVHTQKISKTIPVDTKGERLILCHEDVIRRKKHIKEQKKYCKIYFTFLKSNCFYIKLHTVSVLCEELTLFL